MGNKAIQKNKERRVVKYGGSLLINSDGSLNTSRIKKLVDVLVKLKKDSSHLVVVIGGGNIARSFISTANQLEVNQTKCDVLGIQASRLNAQLVAFATGPAANPVIPTSIQGALETTTLNPHLITFIGGISPGQSTDAVAALIAEGLSANLIRATDVDGIYSKDPELHKNAVLLPEINISELLHLIQESKHEAGGYALFDLVATKVLARSQISTTFLNGNKPENLLKLTQGKKIGTTITYKIK